jgi:hypothetical protein
VSVTDTWDVFVHSGVVSSWPVRTTRSPSLFILHQLCIQYDARELNTF